MSLWSEIQDRSGGKTKRKEDEIRTKEQLVDALERITKETEQQENSDVLSGKLIEVMKEIADKKDIKLLKIEIEVVTQKAN